MRYRILAMLTAVLLTVGLGAGGAGAAPRQVPPPGEYHPTLAQFEAAMKGQSRGPNRWTDYGKATITGFKKSGAHYRPTLRVQNFTGLGADLQAGPDSWWDPASWNWVHYLGKKLADLVTKCNRGILAGVIGGIGPSAAASILFEGGIAGVTSAGFAFMIIGSCTAGIIFG